MGELTDDQTPQADEQSDLDLDGMVQRTFRVPAALMDAYRQRAVFHQVQLGDLIAYAFWRLWQIETESQDWSPDQLVAWAAEVRAQANQQESIADWANTWRKPRHSGRLGVSTATERRRHLSEGTDVDHAEDA